MSDELLQNFVKYNNFVEGLESYFPNWPWTPSQRHAGHLWSHDAVDPVTGNSVPLELVYLTGMCFLVLS